MGHILIASERVKKFRRHPDSEMDLMIYHRTFTGRMTAARYKRLDSYCRRNTYSGGGCGHAWDCCGCLVGQSMSFTYRHNQVVLTMTRSFNY